MKNRLKQFTDNFIKPEKTKYKTGLALGIVFLLCLVAGLAYTLPAVKNTIVLATTVQPEPFTELYFPDHLNLPGLITAGKNYTFSFTVHNLEYQKMTYPYIVYLNENGKKQPIDKNIITLAEDQIKTVTESFKIDHVISRNEIVVHLTNKNQQIDFWVEGTDLSITPTPTLILTKTTPLTAKAYGGWYWQPELNKARIWLGQDNTGQDIWSDQF